MKICSRFLLLACCLSMAVFCLFSCKEKKEGKLEVVEKKYHLTQLSDNWWAIDATGKIKNVGDVDVKNVAVTGVCKSCVEIMARQKWFSSSQNNDIVSSEQKDVVESIGVGIAEASSFDQKDTLSYIPAGDTKFFTFTEFAYFYTQLPNQKPEMPPENELDILIESFLTVDQ